MKAAVEIARAASADAEEQLKSFIDKFDEKNQVLIRAVRKVLRHRLPTANELVYDNYNFFVIGYCSTERPADCIVSIAAGANGVGLSFYRGATLPDPPRCCLVQVIKIVSSVLSQQRRWLVPKLKHSSSQPSCRARRLYRPAEGGGSSSVRFLRSRGRAVSQRSNS
jgi:hypothetical protein